MGLPEGTGGYPRPVWRPGPLDLGVAGAPFKVSRLDKFPSGFGALSGCDDLLAAPRPSGGGFDEVGHQVLKCGAKIGADADRLILKPRPACPVCSETSPEPCAAAIEARHSQRARARKIRIILSSSRPRLGAGLRAAYAITAGLEYPTCAVRLHLSLAGSAHP